MRFDFATATEIRFGRASRRDVAARVRQAGTSVFLVTGARGRHGDEVGSGLLEAGLRVSSWRVAREPTVDDARAARAAAQADGCDVVVALGGGSAIDLGKAVAALLANEGDPMDYLEVVGRGAALTARSRPFVAVPTTAGTGAEVTRNAVLSLPGDGVKVSLRSPLMLPWLAVVDPDLTIDLPPALTASTGMDALTQLVEPYLSVRATPLTDLLCLDAIPRVARSLTLAAADGENLPARTDMALASLYGGLALANAGLGIVHGCAAAIGGRFGAPHGAVCAALLPGALRVNLRAARARGAGAVVSRVGTVAGLLAGRSGERPEAAAERVQQLCEALAIPTLRTYGIAAGDVEAITEAASRASSTRGNPVPLELDEIREVVLAAL